MVCLSFFLPPCSLFFRLEDIESEKEREKGAKNRLLVGPPIAFVIVDIIVIAINIIAICNAICVVLISGDCVSVYSVFFILFVLLLL